VLTHAPRTSRCIHADTAQLTPSSSDHHSSQLVPPNACTHVAGPWASVPPAGPQCWPPPASSVREDGGLGLPTAQQQG
jgi:hypothetical protein